MLEWPVDFEELPIPRNGLAHPPCDVAIIGGPLPETPRNVLISIRGGPHAELALQLSLAVGRSRGSQITSLHITPPNASQDIPFRNIDRVLVRLPEIQRQEVTTDNPLAAILAAARQHDLVVLGATARPENEFDPLGPVAKAILQQGYSKVIVVKTRRPVPANFESETVGQTAISVLVDKWFAENTYHADEFKELQALLDLKRAQNLSISLALPALNEEETVGKVIKTVKRALMDAVPLLDEIVLINSNSTDRTRDIAHELGLPVFIHQQLLPELWRPARQG